MVKKPASARVAVVTDSTAGLAGADFLESDAVRVVPLIVHHGDQKYRENIDITAAAVLENLRSGAVLTTSRPAPAEFSRIYQELADSGYEAVVSLHIAAELSGTYEAAVAAARDAPLPVEVVDSKATGMVLGFGVCAAADNLRKLGPDVSLVAAAQSSARVARTTMEQGRVLFYVDTLDFLHRGGRIGSVSALLGTALSVKPLLTLIDGQIKLSEKVRTRRRALERLVTRSIKSGKIILDDAATVDIAVQHLGAPQAAEEALRQIAGGLGTRVRHRVLADAGAVLGAHVGPGVVAAIVSPVMHS